MGRPYGRRDVVERGYVPPTPDGVRHGKVRLTAMVDQEVHERAFRNAAALGITASRYVAELVIRDQVDADGVPVWAAEFDEQERLSMTR
jgi:hypothetical protein